MTRHPMRVRVVLKGGAQVCANVYDFGSQALADMHEMYAGTRRAYFYVVRHKAVNGGSEHWTYGTRNPVLGAIVVAMRDIEWQGPVLVERGQSWEARL